MTLGGRRRAIARRIAALAGAGGADKLLLRGLQFAIVDEADSVLIDEARTPLILSTKGDTAKEEAVYREALELARALEAAHFRIEESTIELTPAGSRWRRRPPHDLGGNWEGPRRG